MKWKSREWELTLELSCYAGIPTVFILSWWSEIETSTRTVIVDQISVLYKKKKKKKEYLIFIPWFSELSD
jgi:hypothetical protein